MTMQLDANGRLNGWAEGAGAGDAQVEVTSLATVAAGTWTHVAISYDRANDLASLYINGALDSTTDISAVGDDALAFGDAHLGGYNDGEQVFIGSMDDVMAYDNVLTAQEVR